MQCYASTGNVEAPTFTQAERSIGFKKRSRTEEEIFREKNNSLISSLSILIPPQRPFLRRQYP
jgi:hypothetical protein